MSINMDVLVHKALKEKVIQYDNINKSFECLLCETRLTGEPSAKDHLQSKMHRESAVRHVIQNINTSPKSLQDLLSESVMKAAKAKDISVMKSKDILCHVCTVQLSGTMPLDAHLLSKAHLKKKEACQQVSLQQVLLQQVSLPSPTWSPWIQQAIKEGIIDSNGSSELHCNLCSCPCTGEASMKEHMESKKHREACARYAIKNIHSAPRSLIDKLPQAVKKAASTSEVTVMPPNALICNVCNISLTGIISLNDHLVGDDHRKEKYSKEISLEFPTSAPVEMPKVPSFQTNNFTDPSTEMSNPILRDNVNIKEALRKGIIIETDDKLEPFFCKPCKKKFNSPGTLTDHLKCTKHKQKVPFADGRPLSQPGNPLRESYSEVEVSGSWPKRYSVISAVRGHVYIFNNTFKGQKTVRRGAEYDSMNIMDTFSKMGYKVFDNQDLTQENTNQILKAIKRKSELNEIDSFIVFFLSHGKDEYTFLANDNNLMDLRSIRREFTDRQCPYLKGKPKIFFANYCRGNQMERRRIECDANMADVPSDMVTIHASTEGVMALRNRDSGTIFVDSLCRVLKRHAHDMDLRNMYHILENEMSSNKGTKPMWEDYNFLPFHFNPVIR